MNRFKGKKAQGSSGMKLIIAAAILIAILFVAWYFISKGSGSVSIATGCGEYDCKKTSAECSAAGSAKSPSQSWVISLTSCTIPEGQPNAGEKGRCCQPNPLS